MKRWIVLIGFGLCLNASAQLEELKPSAEMMKQGQQQFEARCSVCHNKDGSKSNNSPALKGSKIASSLISGTIYMVVTGGPQHKMPEWGISELSDQELAEILTYVRNSWGNDDKKLYGKYAGGIVTPELVKQHRHNNGE